MIASRALFTLLVIAYAANAYDFSNSYFNHDLHTVMELFEEHSRLVRREVSDEKCAPPAGYIHATCCNGTENFSEIGVQLLKNCSLKAATENYSNGVHSNDPFSCGAIMRKMDRAACLMKCLLREMEGCDDDGNLDESALKEFVGDTIEQENLRTLAEETVSVCVNRANYIQAQHASAYRTTAYPYYTDSHYRTGTPYYRDSYSTDSYYRYSTHYPYTTRRPTGSYYSTDYPYSTDSYRTGSSYSTQYPYTTHRPTGSYYSTDYSYSTENYPTGTGSPYTTQYPYRPTGYYSTNYPHSTDSYYSGPYYTTHYPYTTRRTKMFPYTTSYPYNSGTYRPTGATSMSLGGRCNTAPLTFMQCFWETMILKCPVEDEVSSDNCDNVRNYLKQQQGNSI